MPDTIYPLLLAYAQAEGPERDRLYEVLRGVLEGYTLLPDGAWGAISACTPRTAPLVSRQIQLTLSLPCGDHDRLDPLTFREGATVAEVLSLTALLRWQRTGDVARQVALALHQVALTAPVPPLREALPLLLPAWHIRFTHPELAQARRAIEQVTAAWKDLPLLAGPSDPHPWSLPLPGETLEWETASHA